MQQTPLHTSYNSWTLLKWSDEDGMFRLWFDARRLVIGQVMVAILCLIFSVLVSHVMKHSEDSWIPWVICIPTGVGVLVMAAFKVKREKADGDYLRYDMASDTLTLPRASRVISDAKSSLMFSLERYSNGESVMTEMNVIHNCRREPFLKILGFGVSFDKLAVKLESFGFTVQRFDGLQR